MRMRRDNSKAQAGTTLLELLISVALMTVLMGSVVLCLNTGQKTMRRSEVANTLDQQLRATQQLLAQDMSQAGVTDATLSGIDNPLPLTTLTYGTDTSTTMPTVGSTIGMFDGQTLLVGTGSTQESIIVSAPITATTFTTAFGQNHLAGEGLAPHGIFAQGITPSAASMVSSTQYNSLWIYGDLLGNGTITLVKYDCPTKDTVPYYTDINKNRWAPLIRTEYDNAVVSGLASPKTMYLLDLVAVNANGCFTVVSNPLNTPTLSGTYSFNYITSVTLTVRAMAGVVSSDGLSVTPLLDPSSQQPVTSSRTFLGISPRNIIASYNYAYYCANSSPTITDGEVMPPPAAFKNLP